MCANAIQGADEDLLRAVEYDLADTARDISQGLHNAAVRLSRTICPGTGGAHQAMQLLLAAAWSKTEGEIVQAWHFLAAAVREEQECGELES